MADARYQNGKIYKITSALGLEVYYGSTIQTLPKRMSIHKYKNECNSQLIFEKFGFENCKIDLIENYPCNSRKELETREGWYIRNNKCVNRKIPGRTDAQWYIDNIEKIKQYRIDNKEKIKKQRAEYRAVNKEEIKKQCAEWYINNKELLKEKITCICGSIMSLSGKLGHEKTKQHIDFIKEIIVEKII